MLFSHPGKSSEEAAAPDDAKTVAVVKAGYRSLSRGIALTAELRPWQEIDIHAKVAGYLKDITVDIGDSVKKDQVIATLDLPEQEQDRMKAEADYQVAKLDYDRIQEVVQKQPGLLAQETLDKAQGTYEEAKATYERAKVLAGYATIAAPFDGVVTKRLADPGALVQAGTSSDTQSLPLVHLAQMDRLRLDFPVPESVVPQIAVGMPVDVRIQSTEETLHNKIARIADKIDPTTRTMDVEVDVDNPGLKLKPGMYATATVILAAKDHALSAPVQTVSQGDKPTVWCVNRQGIIEEHSIKVGIRTPEAVEILDGASDGDMLIYGNRGDLSVGMKVMPKAVDGTKG